MHGDPRKVDPPPARPLAPLAGALALGTLTGLAAAQGEFSRALSLTAIALVSGGLSSGSLRNLFVALALFLGAAGRAVLEHPPRLQGNDPQPVSSATRDHAAVGSWQTVAGGLGRIRPAPKERTTPAHRLLYKSPAPPPDGSWVVALPAGTVSPFPRGPLPGPLARAGAGQGTTYLHPDELVVLERGARKSWEFIDFLRRGIARRAQTLEGERSRGLMGALLIGERRALPAGRTDLFTRTGTRHLLALSGLHVALFAVLLLFPITRLVGRWIRLYRPPWEEPFLFSSRSAVLLMYAALAGGSASVMRAAVAVSLAQFAAWIPRTWKRDGGGAVPPRTAGRVAEGLSVWSFGLILEVLSDPAGLSELSLQLSYLATLGILLGTRGFLRFLEAGSAPSRSIEAELSSGIARFRRILVQKLRRFCLGGLAVSLAANLGTLAVVWDTFGEIAPIGWFLAVPCGVLVALLLGLGWIGVLLPLPLTPIPAEMIEALGGALLSLLEFADRMPATPLPLPPRPFALLALASGLVALGWVGTQARPWKGPAKRLALCAWGGLLLPWAAAPEGLELHVLDVGHGSAAVLRAPGVAALIFDAGSRDRTRLFSEALRPLLARWDVSRTEVGLSHDHLDHRSGLTRLIERYPPRRWLGPLPGPLAARAPPGMERVDLETGRLRVWPPGAVGGSPLEVFWLRGSLEGGNEGSRALELCWGGQRILLFGDSEAAGLRGILEALPPGPHRLVLFPHHGSETPLLADLLRELEPAEVWISSAVLPAVGPELERREIPWSFTGSAGPLALRLDPAPP